MKCGAIATSRKRNWCSLHLGCSSTLVALGLILLHDPPHPQTRSAGSCGSKKHCSAQAKPSAMGNIACWGPWVSEQRGHSRHQ